MKLINTSFLSLLLTTGLLTACGGSSGGSTSAAADTPSSSSVATISSSSSAPSSSSSSAPLSSSSSSSLAPASSSSSAEASSASSLAAFAIYSPSFADGETIPIKFTCDGADMNPQLNWEGAPANTKSFAIIVDDPDAVSVVGYTWVHWNIYNISAATTGLAQGVSTHADLLPLGTIEGASSFGSAKYGGPCPPSGRHHYYFQIYALNKETINFSGPLTRTKFEAAFTDSIIAKAATTGNFR
jgi:Raf kinase inhibitor-like YbhB/YbcL family protein